MSEQLPQAKDPNASEQPTGPWDPAEQVGDIYQAEVDEHGHIEQAERLKPRPSIWVGSWLDYNNGVLHGDWITADREDEAIWSDIHRMLARSPIAGQTGETAEDWGVFDYENFGPLRIGEQEDIGWVSAVGRGVAEHGPAFAAWADVVEEKERLADFADAYLGHYESVAIYAEQLVYDLSYDRLLDEALPDSIRGYVQIDTAALGRDMQLGGDIHVLPADEGGVWLFDAR